MDMTTTLIEDFVRTIWDVSQLLLDNPLQITRCEDTYILYNKDTEYYDLYKPIYELKNNNEIDIKIVKIKSIEKFYEYNEYWEVILNEFNMESLSKYEIVLYCNFLTVSCAAIQIYVAYMFDLEIDPYCYSYLPELNDELLKVYRDNKFAFDTYLTTMSKKLSDIMHKNGFDYGILITINARNNIWEPATRIIDSYSNDGYVDIPTLQKPFIKPYDNYDIFDKGFLYTSLYMITLLTVISIDALDFSHIRKTDIGISRLYEENETLLKYLFFYVPGDTSKKLILSSNILTKHLSIEGSIFKQLLRNKIDGIVRKELFEPTMLSEKIVDFYNLDNVFFDIDFFECTCDMNMESTIAEILSSNMIVAVGRTLCNNDDIIYNVAVILANSFVIFRSVFLLLIDKIFNGFENGRIISFSSIDDEIDFVFDTWKDIVEVFIDEAISGIIGIRSSCTSKINIEINHKTIYNLANSVKRCYGRYDRDLIYSSGFCIPIEDWFENIHNSIIINIVF